MSDSIRIIVFSGTDVELPKKLYSNNVKVLGVKDSEEVRALNEIIHTGRKINEKNPDYTYMTYDGILNVAKEMYGNVDSYLILQRNGDCSRASLDMVAIQAADILEQQGKNVIVFEFNNLKSMKEPLFYSKNQGKLREDIIGFIKSVDKITGEKFSFLGN
ncbi:hypothetical protein HZA33_02580 [Candidatus Pacearchaeota archaeon]|nr:hypothetical protein [Candidatus Pacearchaeota archaeon]